MAKRARGITVEIGGDTTKLGNALKSVDSQTRDLERELRGVETLLRKSPDNVNLITQKQKILNQTIGTTRDRLNTLKGAQEQVQAQFDRGEITEEQYRDFQREIVNTEQKLKRLEDQAKEFGGTMGASLIGAGEKVKGFGVKTEELGNKFLGVSAISGAMLVGSAKSAIDFESAWAGVNKTVDGTPEQMDNIRNSILDMSGELPATAIEIAEVAENAGQLGIETDSVIAFTRTMIDMGEATNLSADEASTSLARFANITQMSQSDFDRLGSSIVTLGNNMATTESDIVDMSLRLASTGSQVGLSEDQILALSATMSSLGINAEAGGSAFSRIMQKMNTEVLSGGDNLEAFAKVSGMSAGDFQKAWEEDASQAIVSFVEGLGEINESGGDVTSTLKELGINSTQEINTMLAMSGASDLLTDALDMSAKGWEENSALTEEAMTRYETTESKMEMLRNKIQQVAIQLGEVLLPIINKVVDFVGKLIDNFSGMSDTAQIFIVAVLGIVTAIAPLLIAIGKIAQGVGAVMTILPKLGVAFKAVWTAVTGPVGLVVIAITALVGAFMYLWNTSDAFREFWINLWEIIKNSAKQAWEAITQFFSDAWEWIQETWNGAGEFFTGLWDSIKEVFANTKQFFSDVWTGAIEGIKSAWDSTKTFFTDLWNSIVEGATAGWNWITESIMTVLSPFIDTFNRIWDGISPHLETIWTSIQTIATNAWEILKAIILTPVLMIVDMVTGDFESMGSHLSQIWENVKQSAMNIWNAIKDLIGAYIGVIVETAKVLWENLKNNTINIFNNVKDAVINVWNTLKDSVINSATALKDGAINAWNTLKNGVINGANALKNGAINAWNTLKNSVINIANNIKNSAVNSWNSMKTSVVNLANGIKDGAVRAWNTLKTATSNAFNAVVNFIKNPLKAINLFSIGKDIIQGLINGIKNMAGAVGKAISDVAGNIKNKITGALGIKSPSTWMRDMVGKMIPAGIAVGVERETPEVTDAIDTMGTEIKDASDSSMVQMMNGTPVTGNRPDHGLQNLGLLSTLVSTANDMVQVMNTYLPNIDAEPVVVLETGQVVGGIKNEMNRQLGNDSALSRRGR